VNVLEGDIWAEQERRNDGAGRPTWVVVPTNLRGVMGRGLADQCRQRWPEVEAEYKGLARDERLFWWSETVQRECGDGRCPSGLGYQHRHDHWSAVVLLAVKDDWRDKADPSLITYGLGRLMQWREMMLEWRRECDVLVPLLGCGFGELEPADVEPLIERFVGFDDGFTLVRPAPEVRQRYHFSLRPGSRTDRTAPAIEEV
jgi:hypothetical protein